MFKKMIKLMKTDYSYYLLKRRGTYCSYCPENKCVLCVEEKKYLMESIDKMVYRFADPKEN
tara:strand:+ start:72 stop:254 length:183 start_codon:yes stop_codon:yes gene_type:complete